MYCTGDPDRAPVRCTRAVGLRARRRRDRVRRAHRTREWAAAARRRVDAGSRVRSPTWRRRHAYPTTGFRGTPARRQHRADPRDLADAATGSSASGCAAARRGSRASTTAHRLVDTPTLRAHGLGRRSRRTPPTTRRCARSRRTSPRTSRRHTMQELYDDRLRDEPDARPDQLAPRDPRQRAARRTRLLRPARRLRAVPAGVRRDPRRPTATRRRRGPPAPHLRAARGPCPLVRLGRVRAATPSGAGRVGRHQHPRVRLRRGRPDRDALLRRARRDRAADRVEEPTRLPARVRARPRTTRTASRARRCSTGSTSASATSRST